MMRKVLLLLVVLAVAAPARARTWIHRAGGGPTLKSLLVSAAPGDTIVIEGTVAEGAIVVDKRLTLVGRPGAVIDGLNEDDALLVKADSVEVRGLTFRNPRRSNLDDKAGLKVTSCSGARIVGNRFDHCFFAIYLSGARNALVEGNTVLGRPGEEETMANGIHLWKCSAATIRNNRVEYHRDGIYFEFVTGSTIEGNTTMHNLRYGLHFMFSNNDAYMDNHFESNGAGVAVMFSKEIVMKRNRFLANRGASAYGLLLKEINDGEIADNQFVDNTTGIMVDGCNRLEVRSNTFRSNGWALRLFANATGSSFRANTFAGNTFDLSTNGSLMLNTVEGNYWDRYTGYDLDRDGTGDVPHRPLGFFTLLVERQPYAMAFSRSLFVSLLDRAERLLPSLTPEAMKDDRPLMRPPVSTENVDTPADRSSAQRSVPSSMLFAWLLLASAIPYFVAHG
jgi:nitrous oxidase accessory protein